MRDLRNSNKNLDPLKIPTLLAPNEAQYDMLVVGQIEDILRAKGLDESMIMSAARELMVEVVIQERQYARERERGIQALREAWRDRV